MRLMRAEKPIVHRDRAVALGSECLFAFEGSSLPSKRRGLAPRQLCPIDGARTSRCEDTMVRRGARPSVRRETRLFGRQRALLVRDRFSLARSFFSL